MLHRLLRRLGIAPRARAGVPASARAARMRREGYCYLGGHRALALTHRGQKIFLDTRDIGLTPHIAMHGIWELEVEMVLERLLRPGQTVAEVGSNMGYHTLAMAAMLGPAGHLHAFEASPDVLPLLRATLMVNGLLQRVTVHPKAAHDHSGTLEFSRDPEHIGSGHWSLPAESANYSRRSTVPCVTLDAALGDSVPELHLLRMDAEGSEPQVLRGAEALIRRSPELRIVSEWSPPMMARRADLRRLTGWLDGLGFRFWRIGAEARLEPVPAEALPGLPHCDLVMARSLPD